MAAQKSAGAWGSAAALTALTLGVFFFAKDSGPFAPVKRLHEAAQAGAPPSAATFSSESTEEAKSALLAQVAGLMRQSTAVSLEGLVIDGRNAGVLMVYRRRNGALWAIRFICQTGPQGWRVMADETLSLNMQRVVLPLGDN
jgi:hypothetical protein